MLVSARAQASTNLHNYECSPWFCNTGPKPAGPPHCKVPNALIGQIHQRSTRARAHAHCRAHALNMHTRTHVHAYMRTSEHRMCECLNSVGPPTPAGCYWCAQLSRCIKTNSIYPSLKKSVCVRARTCVWCFVCVFCVFVCVVLFHKNHYKFTQSNTQTHKHTNTQTHKHTNTHAHTHTRTQRRSRRESPLRSAFETILSQAAEQNDFCEVGCGPNRFMLRWGS